MKKTLSVLLTMAITLSLLPATVFAATFNDVSSNHWAYSYIEEMADRKVLAGYPNGSFYPENQVTRAEFAKIMVTAAGLNLSSDSNQYFEDVSKKHWSFPYVTSAMVYLTGYSSPYGNYYYPDKPALREDIAVALVKLKGYDTFGADESIVDTMFTDASSISNDAKKYVATALERGLIAGYEDNTFRGQNSITRAEAAALLWRAYQYGNDNKVTGDTILENFTTPEPTEVSTPTPTATPKPTNPPTKEPTSDPTPKQTSEPTTKADYIVKGFNSWDGTANTFNRVSYDSNTDDVYTLSLDNIVYKRNLNSDKSEEFIDLNLFAYNEDENMVYGFGSYEKYEGIYDEKFDNCYVDFRTHHIYYDSYRERLYAFIYSEKKTDYGSLEKVHEAEELDIVIWFDKNGRYVQSSINPLYSDECIIASYEDGLISQGADYLRMLNPDTLEAINGKIYSGKKLIYGLDVKVVNGQICGLYQGYNYAMLQHEIVFNNYDFTSWNTLRDIVKLGDTTPTAYSMNSKYFYILDGESNRIIRCDYKGNLSILINFDEVDINITDMRQFNLDWKSYFVVSDDEKNIVFFQKVSENETVGRQIVKMN